MKVSIEGNNWKEKLLDVFENPLYAKKILDVLKNDKKKSNLNESYLR
jgi:hypothetical protein